MSDLINKKLADLFAGKIAAAESESRQPKAASKDTKHNKAQICFSMLFFSDVREDISNQQKYQFTRELVEFADQSGFEAVYFPERHFHEFGSIYANNAVVAAYFAPLTKNIRLRTAAVTVTLHHPLRIVEEWAMVDILSNGRVDLGFGNGWNKGDFVLSPDTWDDRSQLRNDRIEMVKKLWRGDSLPFAGPGGEMFDTKVHPRPLQRDLNVWYVTIAKEGLEYAGSKGYNVFTMLYGIDLNELKVKIDAYRAARAKAGFDPDGGTVTLMMHTFVHPDMDWVHEVVATPFKAYIRSSILPHMKFAGEQVDEEKVSKMVEYSYTRYVKTGGIFGPIEECRAQVDKAMSVGVDEIAFLQDFGMDYKAVTDAFVYLKQLVDEYQQ